ncbi:hypothetical protein M011DRAFT_481036 [Sporormia fimetaria CBS 119925]|uniref:C2H2-type domain-containing protein n=1 Tax=Sporormia fimetaria CBS 119925 TaxID=1340428 RepID=A0A6A6UZW6_9PLEO|nr:hypothetical protein M011DRAFT_481036 [Sporormia fimetaria CBS 119925]
MDRQDYQQSGLRPYPSFPGSSSEGSSPDQSAAQNYPSAPQGQDRPSVTPTDNYRPSGAFPEYLNHNQSRPYPQHSAQPGVTAGAMANTNSPSQPLPDGQASDHSNQSNKSDSELPIDPTIASPVTAAYPLQHQQYYPQSDQQPYSYPPRPEQWTYGSPMPGYGHPGSSGPPASAMVSPVQRGPNQLSHTVYSFVPIPGAQQHKRPRRRYEEIERMYKCGWNGCEKAYGTLNHLNAHVTMQSHGTKRTPEEFKEIRKEWKAKKKEEEAARKAEEEARVRAAGDQQRAASSEAAYSQVRPGVTMPGQAPTHHQLPPIGYQAAAVSAAPGQQYGPSSAGMPEGMSQYGASTNSSSHYNPGASPYTQGPNLYSSANH